LARASSKGKPGSAARLTPRQRLSWLRLIRSENVGPATFRAIVNEFGGAEAAIEALPMLSRRGGRTQSIRLCTEEEAEAELEAAECLGASLVAIGEPGYPPALAQVDAPPPLLYAKGRLELADIPIVAIVGARNGSAVGQKFTRGLATELGLEGFVIASGLARGIDTAAHLAALERGTIAVLAGGIDNVYPPENEELQRAIGERGLLISERSPGFSPRGKDFPRRNRLISGISLGVVRGRGRRALRLPDYGALRGRTGPRGLCRARQSARSPLGRIGLFAVGLFQRDIDQIGEERHLGAVGDQSQTLEQRGDIFSGLLARQLLPIAQRAYTACWRPGAGPCHSIPPYFAPLGLQLRPRIA
jgi:DNA protecting protein DprA